LSTKGALNATGNEFALQRLTIFTIFHFPSDAFVLRFNKAMLGGGALSDEAGVVLPPSLFSL
jgi:hypothetical protein